MKHTQGTWEVFKSNEAPFTYCTDLRVINEDKTICTFHHLSKEYSKSFPREEAEANAKLIAAAPDLLEALQTLVNFCSIIPKEVFTEVGANDFQYIINKCSEVINKATY